MKRRINPEIWLKEQANKIEKKDLEKIEEKENGNSVRNT